MTELTVDVPKGSATDPQALAQALEQKLAQLEQVEKAVQQTARPFIVDDVIIVLTVSAKLFGAGALALEALKRLIDAAKDVGQSLGIDKVSVEGRGRVVDSASITQADAQAIASPGG